MSESGGGSRGRHEVRVAGSSSSTTDEDLRELLQERLSLFARIMFWIFWILVVLVAGMYEVWPAIKPERVRVFFFFSVGSLSLAAVIWALALRGQGTSIPALYAIDLAYTCMAGATLGAGAYFQSDLEVAIHAALINHLLMVFARAIIVPSSGRRTAAVSALALVPLLSGGLAVAVGMPERIALPPLAFAAASCLYAAVAVVIAATGSDVIYGLRRQVEHAMKLGNYTLGARISSGGNGDVHHAQHAFLRRPTAIKRILADKVGVESLRRFEREVQSTSLLTHPNTVAIYDYGRSSNGTFYYAMEYLDGVNLDDLVRQDGPQPAARVIHILTQVCGALDEAHERGLIHRDIKPANVILCERGRLPDVAKVIDFGLVKEIAGSGDDSAAQIVMGTPAYISPEAVTAPTEVGPASDLYALGATAYFLLTGQPVFDGKTAIELCLHHVSTPPAPPSTRTRNPIPPELEALVMACLRKDPAQRPASGLELRLALGRLAAARDWDEAVAREWWREHRQRRPGAADATAPQTQTLTVDVVGRTEPVRTDEIERASAPAIAAAANPGRRT